MKKIYSIVFFLLFSGVVYSQGGPWDDKIICGNESIEIGDGGTEGACYSWTASPDDPSVKNAKSNTVTVSPKQPTTYTRITVGKDFGFTKPDHVNVLILTGFEMTLPEDAVCDGSEVEIILKPIPSSMPIEKFISCLSELKFTSETFVKPYGNPANSTQLIFSRIENDNNINAKSKILNALWYSTQPDHCNSFCSYKINASVNINGQTLGAEKILIVKVTFSEEEGEPGCFIGKAKPTNYFSGDIVVTPKKISDDKYEAVITQGTFKRDVKAIAKFDGPSGSQYYAMGTAEENFHKGQIEGTTSSINNDLWLAKNVMNDINSPGQFIGNTEVEVETAARNAFKSAKEKEIDRSNKIAFNPGPRRCNAEKEAKSAVGASYKFAFSCTYADECQ